MIGLKDKYKDYFKIGAAVNAKSIHTHKDILLQHFNSITCENEMKFSSVCNEEGNYDFSASDKIAEFARNNNLALRGHTFTWHNQTPKWVFENANEEVLTERLKNHIAILGGRYQKDIYCWDVVNEAIEDKSDIVIRESGWSSIMGEKFMDRAFMITKELLPEAKLYYNEYNETDPIKSIKIYNTIKGMLERGVPVEGIGMQCHFNIYHPSPDELKRSIELYASLGLQIHITEMDVSMFEFSDRSSLDKPTKELIEMQAKVYGSCFKIFREYKDAIDCITTWGVADDATWLDNFPVYNRKNWPLLFDNNHMPKESLLRIMDF
jgi:endo-1,4-beta-xylanase